MWTSDAMHQGWVRGWGVVGGEPDEKLSPNAVQLIIEDLTNLIRTQRSCPPDKVFRNLDPTFGLCLACYDLLNNFA